MQSVSFLHLYIKRGETALMMASRIGMKEMVELLLNRGAKIESTDNVGVFLNAVMHNH